MVAAVAILPVSGPAFSADIETLLMPGEVISDHAEFESECSQCHARFSKRSQRRLCLDCHDEIDEDVTGRQGFHGRLEDADAIDCKSCHSEHLGRTADIVHLNPATFSHRATDFPLHGKHASVTCAACHSHDKKYRETASACHDCHEKQEPHKGNLGESCSDCHNEKTWHKVRFDHDKTDFPLEGKHGETGCNACHIGEHYEGLPKTCNSCHAINDVHAGSNGTRCNDCHNQRDWKKPDFDHDRETEFPLRGRHGKISCTACHTRPATEESPPRECIACHRQDDAHHGRYGKECQTCHGTDNWQRSRFDHGRDTDFSLKGKHSELICSACHRGNLHKETLSINCFSCHTLDDVHHGQEGEQCERCHDAGGWDRNIVFDHDVTRFPLLGLHAATPCEECHLSPAFQDASSSCNDCHHNDDVHKETLGTECGQCHNPNAWNIWLFDHNEQTDFALDGAHQDLHCADCHTRPVNGSLDQSMQCRTCHKQDDSHQGRFGSDCARCHTTRSFRDVQIN